MREENYTSKNQFVVLYKLGVYSYSVLGMAQIRVRVLRNSYFQGGSKYFPFEAGIYERIGKEELERGWIFQDIENMKEYEKRMNKIIEKFGIFHFKGRKPEFYGADNFMKIRIEQKRVGYDDDTLYKLVAFERHEGPDEKAEMPPRLC